MSHSRRGIRSHFVVFALTVLCGLLGAQKCHAQAYTWNVSGTASWTTPTNWLPNGVPGTSITDTVTISSGTPQLTTNETIQSLTVAGTVDISGGAILTTTNATIQNGGQLNNSGTLVVSGAMTTDSSSTTVINTVLNVLAGATVTVNSGTLDLHQGLNNGTITATAGTSVHVTPINTYTNGTGVFVGTLTVDGMLQFNSPVSMAPLITLNNLGTLSGTVLVTITTGGSLTTTGNVNVPMLFNSGATLSMSANPVFNSNVTCNGTGSVNGVSTLTINGGATLDFGGTTSINANSGAMTITGAGTFSNSGTMTNITNTINIACNATNSGTMMNNVGSTTSINVSSTFTNSGSIQTLNSGAAVVIVSTGTMTVAGGGGFSGGLVVVYGTLTVNTTLAIPGTLLVGYSTNFGGSGNGTVNGTGAINITGTMTVSGNAGSVLSIAVPITTTAPGVFNLSNVALTQSADIINNSTVTLTGSSAIMTFGGTLSGNGTVNLTSGPQIKGTGSISSACAFSLSGGGAGIISVPATIDSMSTAFGTSLQIDSSLACANSFSYNTNSAMVINSPATLTLQGTSTMNTGTINGSGTLAVASTGTLSFTGIGTQTINPTVNVAGALSLNNSAGNTTIPNLINTGTVTVTQGQTNVTNGSSTAPGMLVTNGAAVLKILNNTNFANSGAMSGTFVVAGQVTQSGALTIPGSLQMGDGATLGHFAGSGSISITGTLTDTSVSGSVFDISATVGSAGTMNLTDNGIEFKNGLTNNGITTLTLSGLNVLKITGSTFTNNGTLNLQGNISGTGNVSNAAAGTITVTASQSITCPVANAGNVTLQSGVTLACSGGYVQSAGTSQITLGGLTSNTTLNGGNLKLSQNCTLTGSLTNTGGAISFLSRGKLAITTNYTQGSAGSFATTISGTAVGNFDQLVVTGSATLNGALNVSLSAYAPVPSDTFAVITSAGVTSTFTSYSPGTSNLTPSYSGTAVTLINTVIPNPVPTSTTLSPASVVAGSSAFVLLVNGSNFLNSSSVLFNGTGRPTLFISSTLLGAAISTSDISSVGSASITVTNPAPGGGTAAALTLTISPPAPAVITSALTASGFVNQTFAYVISATGNPPPTYSATGLPAGLSLNGSTIVGTPSGTGTTSVMITAANVHGTDSKTLVITIGTAVSNPLVAGSVDVLPNPGRAGAPITFTANTTGGAGPLTFAWDFGDGTAPGSGNPVTHIYNVFADSAFTVKVSVGDGTVNVASSVNLSVLAPNSGADGVLNASDGKPAVANPLTGISQQVTGSNGGVIQLAIDVSALNRAGFDVSTDFPETIAGRSSTVAGIVAVHKYVENGVYVATSTATPTGSTTVSGKSRKTLTVSAQETGETVAFSALPSSRAIQTSQLKGKFVFSGKTAADSVTFGGTLELPAGLDLSKKQVLNFAIGNIVDTVSVDGKGKGAAPGANKRITKLQLKYPKLAAGALTTAGQKVTLSATVSGTALSAAGFDTEGIAAGAKDAATKTGASRSIQVAVVFAGVSYEALAPATFKLATNGSSGQIAGRSGL